MSTAVRAVIGNRVDTPEKGDVAMKQSRSDLGLRFTSLLSPAALRMELLGIVLVVLLAGRSMPSLGKVLLQYSQFLFR
jgi:hypothetical protein